VGPNQTSAVGPNQVDIPIHLDPIGKPLMSKLVKRQQARSAISIEGIAQNPQIVSEVPWR
jgi:hypothetical protein